MTPDEFKYKDLRHPMDGLRDIDDKDKEIARLRDENASYEKEIGELMDDVQYWKGKTKQALNQINELKG